MPSDTGVSRVSAVCPRWWPAGDPLEEETVQQEPKHGGGLHASRRRPLDQLPKKDEYRSEDSSAEKPNGSDLRGSKEGHRRDGENHGYTTERTQRTNRRTETNIHQTHAEDGSVSVSHNKDTENARTKHRGYSQQSKGRIYGVDTTIHIVLRTTPEQVRRSSQIK